MIKRSTEPPDPAALIEIVAFVQDLLDQGIPEAEAKRLAEQHMFLIKREDRYHEWLQTEHQIHALSLAREDEDSEDLL